MTQISEIVGYEGGWPVLRDIFRYEPGEGRFSATGTRPECLAKLDFYGVQCPLELFEPTAETLPPVMAASKAQL